MINKIDNNVLNAQNPLQETQSTQVVSAQTIQNAYGNNRNSLIDESDISNEAVLLYQREQEIRKYSEYLNNISVDEATNKVVGLMEKGIINISDEELAESMFQNLSLLNELFN